MTSWPKRSTFLLLPLAGLIWFGWARDARVSNAPKATTREITLVVHGTDHEFIAASGASTPYPTGPLAPGDRVVGRDQDFSQTGSPIGTDYEVCTASFDLHVLCNDTIDEPNVGQLHVTWMFQWPTSGTTGPSAWSGAVEGGTGAFKDAIGDYQAQAQSNGDDLIVAHITQPN
jgi:hypothetical protein